MAQQVFISYAHEDEKAACAVVNRLSEWDFNCWIDRNKIAGRPGERWLAQAIEALQRSDVVVVVCSRHTNDSTYVEDEVQHARERRIPFIVFRIDNAPLSTTLEFLTKSSMRLEAFPLYERHLDKLAESVWRLSEQGDGGAAGPRAAGPGGPVPRVGWRRWVSAQATHLRGSLVQLFDGAGRPDRAAVKEPARGGWADWRRPFRRRRPADYERAFQEDPRELVEAARWWRIKEIIEALEAKQAALGPWSKLKRPLKKRLAAFHKAHEAANEALKKTGITRARAHFEGLRRMITDHPDLVALQDRMQAILDDRNRLQEQVMGLQRAGRWTAIENAIRAFVLGNGQSSQSLLDAAARASAEARRETGRFNLFMWAILGAVVVAAACGGAEAWSGVNAATPAQGSPPAEQAFVAGLVGVMVRFGTVSAVLGWLLLIFGVRQQAGFFGEVLLLMAVAMAAQSLRLLPDPAAATAASMLAAVALVTVMQFATCLLIGVRPRSLPGVSMTLAACAAACGLGGGPMAIGDVGGAWARWLPHAFIAGGWLAVSGLVLRRRDWWIPAVVAGMLGLLGLVLSPESIKSQEMLLPAAVVCLMLAGWMACRPATFAGYVAVVAIAGGGCLFAEGLRAVDRGTGVPGQASLSLLLSLWAIACGITAIRNRSGLSARLWFSDMLAKQTLLAQCSDTKLAGRQLAETRWFHEGRDWHAKNAPDGSAPAAAAGPRPTGR